MPELDPFDARLSAAVHAFADRAATGVDAVAMAERSVRRRRTGAFAWLWSPLPVPAGLLVTLVLLLGLLAWSLQVGGPIGPRPPVAPLPAPSVSPAPTASPPPTPLPPTDGEGDEIVGGTETVLIVTRGTSLQVGDVRQTRGLVATTVDTMNDPRVTGTGTLKGENDTYGSVGPEWGTYHLENADGAWDGTWTGARWDGGNVSQVTAWLIGSGAYKGYSYYLIARGTNPMRVDGLIVHGSPPTP
jgi:hypothetical protein